MLASSTVMAGRMWAHFGDNVIVFCVYARVSRKSARRDVATPLITHLSFLAHFEKVGSSSLFGLKCIGMSRDLDVFIDLFIHLYHTCKSMQPLRMKGAWNT